MPKKSPSDAQNYQKTHIQPKETVNCVKDAKSIIADSIVKPMEINFSDQKVDFQC